MADKEVSPYVWAAMLEASRRMQQRELDISHEILTLHNRLFPSYLEYLSQYFLQNFYTTLRDDKQPGWDLVHAKQIDAEGTLTAATDDFLDDVGEEVDEALEEAIEDAVEEGFQTGLWLAKIAGVDLGEPPDVEFPDYGLLIAGATIGGLSALDRAAGWRANYRTKLLQSFNGLTVTQGTLLDTTSMTRSLWTNYVNNVAAMATNEVYWGFSVAESAALQIFSDMIEEVWVTMYDERVCPICRPLHYMRTALLPVRDSHPGCRCWKAPILILEGGDAAPVDYDTFVATLRSVQ